MLVTMEDTRALLFSCWIDLGNDKILSAIDCGVLFYRLLVPQWIMIRSGLFFSVNLIYSFLSSVWQKYTFFYKQHFYKQHQDEIGKKLSKI